MMPPCSPTALPDAGPAAVIDMLAAAAVLPDADLPLLACQVAAAVVAQFAREEELLARTGCPCLADHRAIHCALAGAIAGVADAAHDLPPRLLRRTLSRRIARLLRVHFAGADRMSARYLARRRWDTG